MPRTELYYLEKKTAEKIEVLVKEFASDTKKMAAEQLYDKLTEMLPIQKSDMGTVRRRIEGLYVTSEFLWQEALKIKNDRHAIVKMAELKPLSHYHYLTGSREPVGNVMTRADYLNDPSTAIVKLKDDIIGLARAFPKLASD